MRRATVIRGRAMTQADLIFDPTGEKVRERHKHGPVGEVRAVDGGS